MTEVPMDAPPRRPVPPQRRETRPVRRNLVIASVLFATFTVYTWLVVHWGPFIRLDDYLDRNFHVHKYWPVLHVLDRVGQRAVCLPILAAIALIVGWRHRSWRPALLAAAGVFTLNLLVLIVKLAMSRGAPLSGQSFFGDGDLYPSGHTSNIVVVYGLCFYLITHYGRVTPMVRRFLIAMLCIIPVIMFTTSLLLRWHWFSDLMGGFMIGGAVLALTMGIDAAMPFRSSKLVVLPRAVPPTATTPPRPVVPAGRAAAVSANSRPIRHPASHRAAPPAGVTPRRRPAGSPTAVADRRSSR